MSGLLLLLKYLFIHVFRTHTLIRLVDILLALMLLVVSLPIQLLLVIIGLIETGSPFFVQERLGKGESVFRIFKFRSMKMDTVSVGTHLVDASKVTATGKFIRRFKLDELPQLVNVLLGDMSFVGPRPCLPTQEEVIKERRKLNIFTLSPGITGPSQISGIDMSEPEKLALNDSELMTSFSLISYFKYVIYTFLGKGGGDRIKQSSDKSA